MCYKKHGYPPGYKARGQHRGANMVATNVQDPSMVDEFQSQADSTTIFDFTAKQYRSLLALLPSSSTPTFVMDSGSNSTCVNMANVPQPDHVPLNNGNSSSSVWILDTSATDHICTSLSFFTSFTLSRPVTVHLPNGSK